MPGSSGRASTGRGGRPPTISDEDADTEGKDTAKDEGNTKSGVSGKMKKLFECIGCRGDIHKKYKTDTEAMAHLIKKPGVGAAAKSYIENKLGRKKMPRSVSQRLDVIMKKLDN